MKIFRIYYSYVIKNTKSGEVTKSKKDTFEIEAETRASINTDDVRYKIRKMANEVTEKGEEILHANYYNIEEV